jgi:hypothetical protein
MLECYIGDTVIEIPDSRYGSSESSRGTGDKRREEQNSQEDTRGGEMKYKILYGGAIIANPIKMIERLEKEVVKYIENGWKPMGGITSWDGVLYQAMIREEPGD